MKINNEWRSSYIPDLLCDVLRVRDEREPNVVHKLLNAWQIARILMNVDHWLYVKSHWSNLRCQIYIVNMKYVWRNEYYPRQDNNLINAWFIVVAKMTWCCMNVLYCGELKLVRNGRKRFSDRWITNLKSNFCTCVFFIRNSFTIWTNWHGTDQQTSARHNIIDMAASNGRHEWDNC